MENKDFITLLKRATTDKNAVVEILELISPLIEKYSKIDKKFDEDLHSELIENLIKLLHKKDFYKIIENYNKF